MKIKTDLLILNPIEKEDIEIIHSYTSDYSQISPFYTTYLRSKNYWLDRYSKTGLWDDDYGMLKILNALDEKFIGVIWYFRGLPYAEGFELGFNIFNKKNRSKGYAAEALEVFSSYLFSTYNIRRLQCNTLLANDHPSIKILTERTGFEYEGTMRKAMYIRGEFIDLSLFSILKEDAKPLDSLVSKI